MISGLMIITSIAMLAFPKQLRGNRIPSPHQVESIDAHKATPKEDKLEEERPQLKGTHNVYRFLSFAKLPVNCLQYVD